MIIYNILQPTLSTSVGITSPSYLLHDSLTSSIDSSSTIATNEEPVPESPEANAPASSASIAIEELKPKVAE